MLQAPVSQSMVTAAVGHAGNVVQPQALLCSSQLASGQQLCASLAIKAPDAQVHKRPRPGSNSGTSSDGSFNLPANNSSSANTPRVAVVCDAYIYKDGKPTSMLGQNLSGTLNNNVPGHSTPSPASARVPAAAVCSNAMVQSGAAPNLDCFLRQADGFSVIVSSSGTRHLCSNSPVPSAASTGLVQLLQQQLQQLQAQNADLHKRLEAADNATAAAQLMLQRSQQQHLSVTQQLQEEQRAKETELQNMRNLLHTAQQDISTLQAEKAALEVVLDHLMMSAGASSDMRSAAPQQLQPPPPQQQQQPVVLAAPPQGPRAGMGPPASAAPAAFVKQGVLSSLAGTPAPFGGCVGRRGPCMPPPSWTQAPSRLNPKHREHALQGSSTQPECAADGSSAAEQAAQPLVDHWGGVGSGQGATTAAYAPAPAVSQSFEGQMQPNSVATHRVDVMELPLEDVVGNGEAGLSMAFMPPLSPSDLGF